jgi:nucleotidyltransferase substrate binding protein (TIGR01987 family)
VEKLNQKISSCQQALATLAEAVQMPFSMIVRDACIQRFEYSFESLWKLLKVYLAQHEGLLCNSPKSCFREALAVGLLGVTETETCLIMTDDRNLTSHTYLEPVAEAIYQKLPGYLEVMQGLLTNIQTHAGKSSTGKVADG